MEVTSWGGTSSARIVRAINIHLPCPGLAFGVSTTWITPARRALSLLYLA